MEDSDYSDADSDGSIDADFDDDSNDFDAQSNPDATDGNSASNRNVDCMSDEISYTVLTKDQVTQVMNDIIHDVSSVIELPPNIATILLRHFKWEKDVLLEKYFDGNRDALFQEAHMISPFKRIKTLRASKKNVDCLICAMSCPVSSMSGLKCGHRFCRECWTEYLTTKITEDGMSGRIACPAFDCDILVDDETVMSVITDPTVIAKYQDFVTNCFVECCRVLRWCPSPDCKYCAKSSYAGQHEIKCKCGHSFCFGCGEKWHEPIQCDMLKKWLKKCNDDGASLNWITANTKDCPKCFTAIQKDGGCNHVTCRKKGCYFEFCWVCLASWAGHDEHYKCNKYNPNDPKSVEPKQRPVRADMERFLFFSTRHLNHQNSYTQQEKLKEAVAAKITEFQAMGHSMIEVEFLPRALDVLNRCRKTLMYTYVFAFYVEKNNQAEIFEDNQSNLEAATETLCGYLEQDMADGENKIDYADLKQKAQNKASYCESRCKALMDHLREGYKENWWIFRS